MNIITKVKGVDDFGKEKISGNLFQYSHHYPRTSKGDFLIYFYPKNNAIGIYQAKEELEYYNKDGFQYCRGTMARYDKSALEFIEFIKTKNIELAKTSEKVINNLFEKYPVLNESN